MRVMTKIEATIAWNFMILRRAKSEFGIHEQQGKVDKCKEGEHHHTRNKPDLSNRERHSKDPNANYATNEGCHGGECRVRP